MLRILAIAFVTILAAVATVLAVLLIGVLVGTLNERQIRFKRESEVLKK